MSNVFKLSDVELYWANLYTRNKLSNKYQVDLVNLTEDQIKLIEETGVSVRSKDDERGFFVTCKSSNYEIIPHDKNGDTIGPDILVGNGSRANVMVKPYGWTNPQGKKGLSLGISKLVVTDLKQYVPEDNLMEEEETL
jgi:hypothetical protein